MNDDESNYGTGIAHIYVNGSAAHIKHLMRDKGWSAARVLEYFQATQDHRRLDEIIKEQEDE